MIELRGKRVVVVGLGASGVAACRLCLARGALVIGTDAKPAEAISEEARGLAGEGVVLALGGHAEARLPNADLVVLSPGVPMFPELDDAGKRGVRIWGEVELATRALSIPVPIVAVGGTNGKSTTTSLVGALLERANKRVFTGGNLGEPLSAHTESVFDVIVLEVSSFQMERVEAFRPRVSLLLNVSPDHLDRYPSLAAYADAKGNAFLRQTEEDVAVVPFGDEVCRRQAERGRGRIVTFGGHGSDVAVTRDAIVDGATMYERSAIALGGGHNALNVAAALAAIRPFDVPASIVRDVLATFSGLPHRMAFVRDRAGVRFYDDSKGTNVGAAVTAVQGVREERVVLIAGGKDKGGGYAPLALALRERGRGAVLIGEAKELIARAIGDAVPVKTAGSMEEAVALAAEMARPGDAVLLSPACSSFDMFRDYKERGDVFAQAVLALEGSA